MSYIDGMEITCGSVPVYGIVLWGELSHNGEPRLIVEPRDSKTWEPSGGFLDVPASVCRRLKRVAWVENELRKVLRGGGYDDWPVLARVEYQSRAIETGSTDVYLASGKDMGKMSEFSDLPSARAYVTEKFEALDYLVTAGG